MRISDFCSWVNTDLLPNSTLELGFPRRTGSETARKWLHTLGFDFVSTKKGSFIDEHECKDVVSYRKKFQKWWDLDFLGLAMHQPRKQRVLCQETYKHPLPTRSRRRSSRRMPQSKQQEKIDFESAKLEESDLYTCSASFRSREGTVVKLAVFVYIVC